MRKFNSSALILSLFLSFFITLIFVMFSYIYVKESINSLQSNEKFLLFKYANKITKSNNTIKDYKEFMYGSIESFIYKVSILDENDHVLYTTFKNPQKYDCTKDIYIQDKTALFNSNIILKNFKNAKIIFKKDIDFTVIKERIFILCILLFSFFVFSTLFLYLNMTKVYSEMRKRVNIFFKDAIHEIRTPLGVIQLNLDFLENKLQNTKSLKRAQGALVNLSTIYESIEYYIKNDKINYLVEKINLSDFLIHRISFFTLLADIKEINININIKKDIFLNINNIQLQRLIDNNPTKKQIFLAWDRRFFMIF